MITSYKKQIDILFVFPVWSFCLNVNTVDAVEHVEVVHINRTGIGLHGGEYICQRNTGKLNLVAVYIEIKLWYLSLKRGRKSCKFFTSGSIIH